MAMLIVTASPQPNFWTLEKSHRLNDMVQWARFETDYAAAHNLGIIVLRDTGPVRYAFLEVSFSPAFL